MEGTAAEGERRFSMITRAPSVPMGLESPMQRRETLPDIFDTQDDEGDAQAPNHFGQKRLRRERVLLQDAAHELTDPTTAWNTYVHLVWKKKARHRQVLNLKGSNSKQWTCSGPYAGAGLNSDHMMLIKKIGPERAARLLAVVRGWRIRHKVKNTVLLLKEAELMFRIRMGQVDIIMEMVAYVFTMCLFFYVIIAQRGVQHTWELQHSIKTAINSIEGAGGTVLEDVGTLRDMWAWTDTFVDEMTPDTWYNDDPLAASDLGYVQQYNFVIGGFRLQQFRVPKNQCKKTSVSFTQFFDNCYAPLEFLEQADRTAFGPPHDTTKYEVVDGPLGPVNYIDLPPDKSLAKQILRELRQDLWADKQTRQVRIGFLVYNPAYNLFCVAEIAFNQGASGVLNSEVFFQSIKFFPYSNPSDRVRAVFEVVLILMVLQSLVLELRQLWEVRNKPSLYFKYYWNYLDLGRPILLVISMGSWFYLYTDPLRQHIVDMKLPTKEYIDMIPVAIRMNQFASLNAFTCMLFVFGLFKFVSFWPDLAVITGCLSDAGPGLLAFFALFCAVFFGFSFVGTVMYGPILQEWHTFGLGMQTSFAIVMGEYGVTNLETTSLLGWADEASKALWYYCFIAVIYFLFINVLLAIVMDSYENVSSNKAKMLDAVGTLQPTTLITIRSMRRRLKAYLGLSHGRRNWSNGEWIDWLVKRQDEGNISVTTVQMATWLAKDGALNQVQDVLWLFKPIDTILKSKMYVPDDAAERHIEIQNSLELLAKQLQPQEDDIKKQLQEQADSNKALEANQRVLQFSIDELRLELQAVAKAVGAPVPQPEAQEMLQETEAQKIPKETKALVKEGNGSRSTTSSGGSSSDSSCNGHEIQVQKNRLDEQMKRPCLPRSS